MIDYLIILLIFIFLIYFFSARFHFSIKNPFTSPTQEPYTNWTSFSMADPVLVNSELTAININPSNRSRPRNFGNFGIIGKFPAMPICNSCHLEFDCNGYAYDSVDDRNMNVCRKCDNNLLEKNYNQLDRPISVYARSAGRPRQCRQIN